LSQLTTVFADNYDGNTPETVHSVASLDLDWTNGTWHDLLFDTPFLYNGMDNLIIEWLWEGDEGQDVYVSGWYPPGGSRVLDGGSVGSTTGLLRDYSNRLRVHFANLDLVGTIEGGALVLNWSTIPAAQEYWVYGAPNLPFFSPGLSPGFEYRIDVVPQGTVSWTGQNGVGDISENWYYLVMAVDGTGRELIRSSRFGEFDYQAEDIRGDYSSGGLNVYSKK